MIQENTFGSPIPDYNICIIGSGPAGMTLATALARNTKTLRICLLESGQKEATRFADTLREVESSGISIKAYSRERILGGASLTWSGLSSPLDEIDFETRPWLPYPGWPIRRSELIPYYEEASRSFRFPDLSLFDTKRWETVLKAGDFVPFWENLKEKVFLAAQDPQRFGTDYLHIFNSERVDLYLDATVVRLEGNPQSGEAELAVIRTSDGREGRVQAGIFVLACGGIENARQLLLTTFACARGLGNENDQVGRYLMNHPKENYGLIVLKRPLREMPAYFGFHAGGFSGSIGLQLTDAHQREWGMLNTYIRLRPVFDWSDHPGVEAALFYLKRSRLLLQGFHRLKRGKIISLRDYAETGDDNELQNDRKTLADHRKMVKMIWKDRSNVLDYLVHRLSHKKAVTVRTIRIRNFMEMEPRPENRVTLGSCRDAFGNPVARVYHQVSTRDRKSLQAIHHVLRDEVHRAGWGRLISDLSAEMVPWPVHLDASHHMGTTRMGHDPSTSVVNADSRVHSSPNVYVVGSSVFPTGGCANPTYTIVALSLRLAHHLLSNDTAIGNSRFQKPVQSY